MKSTIYLSFLLICLQALCHNLPRHHGDQGDRGDENPPEHQHPPLDQDHGNETIICQKIAPRNANFAFEFYRQIASDAAAQNIFFSPLSLSTAFALLTLGAKAETLNQIHKGLAFNLSEIEEKQIHDGFRQLIHVLTRPNNKAHVNIGNALFIEESLKLLPTFLENIETLYNAAGFLTNFNDSTAAEKQINNYVQSKTHGKISQAVEGLEPKTLLVLVNYIFFKAYWKEPFDTVFVREEDFFVDANTTVKVSLMYRKSYYQYLHDEDLSCWVVEVPYKGDAVALFILPDEGKMKEVEGALGKETLSKWMISLTYEKIHLYIPKFSISASYDIKDFFQRMGVTDVFSGNADLSGITGERNLKVSKAVHKAVLDVHEGGTEAAAVTTIEMMFRSASFQPTPIIKFNRPFLMLIFDVKTCSILFMGKIVDPAEK